MPRWCATINVPPSATKALSTIQMGSDRFGLDVEGTIVSGQ
jgi:hypothetical protein